jgi:hypothetical protein
LSSEFVAAPDDCGLTHRLMAEVRDECVIETILTHGFIQTSTLTADGENTGTAGFRPLPINCSSMMPANSGLRSSSGTGTRVGR